ncbi:MAG: hypothetical protein LLH30_06805 [Candidatus Manganitrophus sp. SA1]|nr:hypothetical protein [Candidatus Manganitrophus morganii]
MAITVKGKQGAFPAGGKLRYDSPQNFFAYFLFSLLGIFFFTPITQAQVTYQYDTYSAPYTGTPNGTGRVTSVTDPTGSTTFFYDARGNVTKTVKVIEGNSFTIESTYDSLNRVMTTTYPDTPNPEVVTNTYDAAGNLKTVTGPATSYVTDITYNAFNQRTKITFGNNVSTTYAYDSNNFRLSQICTRLTLNCSDPASTPAVLQNINYGYDAVGNVIVMADGVNSGNSQAFTYDDLNRLKTANGPYGNFTNTPYQYDPIGNMTYNPLVGNYTYPQSGIASVRPHAVQTAGGSSNIYSYDDNGNMTAGPSYDASGNLTSATARTLTYDMENRPTTVVNNGVQATMAYDFKGSRVKKTVAGVTTYYVGRIYEKKGSATVKYIFVGTTRVAMKSSDGSVNFYHSNHLDSTHLMTNVAGAKVEEIRYAPFGGGFSLSDSGSINVNHKYTSQEFDSEAGLYYYKARYYDPALGRFISADSIVQSIKNPQFLNRYSYVINNPIRYFDPSGNITDTPCFAFCRSDSDSTGSSLGAGTSPTAPGCGVNNANCSGAPPLTAFFQNQSRNNSCPPGGCGNLAGHINGPRSNVNRAFIIITGEAPASAGCTANCKIIAVFKDTDVQIGREIITIRGLVWIDDGTGNNQTINLNFSSPLGSASACVAGGCTDSDYSVSSSGNPLLRINFLGLAELKFGLKVDLSGWTFQGTLGTPLGSLDFSTMHNGMTDWNLSFRQAISEPSLELSVGNVGGSIGCNCTANPDDAFPIRPIQDENFSTHPFR